MGKNSCVVKAESMRNTSNSGKKLYISEIRKCSSLGIIEKIHSMLENQEIFNSAILWNNGDLDASAFHEVVIKGDLKKYVQVLAERLHLNLEQALFIPFFVKNLDEAQDYRDISRYFNCIETYRIIEHSETLESLAALGYINIETNYRNEICFRMPASVVQCIVQGKQPEPISNGAGKDKKEKVDKNELLSNLEIVNNVVELTKEKGLPDIDNNEPLKQHLLELGKRFSLNNEEALFLSLFIHMCDDSNIRYFDFARYFSVKTPQVMQYVNTISSLINLGYVTRSSDCRVNSFRIPENVVRDFTLWHTATVVSPMQNIPGLDSQAEQNDGKSKMGRSEQ